MEIGENLGQERIIESQAVGPEVQGIQTTVEALFPVERIGVAPGVSAGLVPKHHTKTSDEFDDCSRDLLQSSDSGLILSAK